MAPEHVILCPPLCLSNAAMPMPQSPSCCEKDEDSQEALKEGTGGVRRDGLRQDKQDSDGILSALWYRLGEVLLPNRETLNHEPKGRKKPASFGSGKRKAHPSVLHILSGGGILSRRLMIHNSLFTITNVTHLLDSQEERA